MSFSQPDTEILAPENPETAISLLHELVAIPSLSAQEGQAVQYLVHVMTELGYDAEIDSAGSAIGRIGTGPTEVVLLGHIDTVPGEIPVRIEGGTLHGRGAVDAKGPLATFVMAAARAAGTQSTITVVGAVGEEAIGSYGANAVAQWSAPDFCIIGEPSGWDAVCLGYRGTVSLEYRLVQAARHTAGPGESIAEIAVQFWNAVSRDVAELNGTKTGFNAVSGALRSFNTESDGLHDTALLSIGFRLPPSISSEEILAIVNTHLGDGTIELFGVQEGYETSKRTSLTPPFLREIRAANGTPRFTKKLGTSDMTVVGPVWQCPIVAYGPGDASLDHTPEERIELDEYLKAIDVLAGVLRTL